jgi:hypothetical protein
MAGGVFSSAKLNGMTIRESATDGSDFTNPDADYRRLFLGEDGQLHVKDSAGAVTDIAGSGNVATDAIWDAAGDLAVGSGANTAARLAAGAAGGVLAMGNSVVIWNAGTSFPGSKATNDRYWRTDLGMEFYWDGTRWVSSVLHTLNTDSPTALSATSPFASLATLKATFASIWLVNLHVRSYVATTNDGSKYWTVALKNNSDSGVLASQATGGDTANTDYNRTVAIGASSTEGGFFLEATKTSTPGNLSVAAIVTFRVIAT